MKAYSAHVETVGRAMIGPQFGWGNREDVLRLARELRMLPGQVLEARDCHWLVPISKFHARQVRLMRGRVVEYET